MKSLTTCFLFSVLMLPNAFAQLLPQGSHVELYFPQVADGGNEWQTTFIFVNPDDTVSAAVKLSFFKGDGSGLSLDFGSGAAASHTFTIPPRGTKTLRSTGSSAALNAGWALATATIPVQGIASYRQLVGGVPKQEVSVYPTVPTINFSSPATRLHGFAIANVHILAPITVEMEIRNSEGSRLANPVQITIPALGYQAGYVSQIFPTAADFSGTLNIRAADTCFPRDNEFVAMTLSSDEKGIWSGLPSGAFPRPIGFDYGRIGLVYKTILNAARKK